MEDQRDIKSYSWSEKPDSEEELESDQHRVDDLESDCSNINSPPETDTEQSSDETVDDGLHRPNDKLPFYVGKDKSTKWLMHKPLLTGNCNTVIHLSEVKQVAKNANTPLLCLSLFLDDTMIDKIVIYTNIYITKLLENYSREHDCKPTDSIEIRALIGVLYMAGLHKKCNSNVKEMWLGDGTACDFFRATMPIKRFFFLLKVLRFDDINTQKNRKQLDNLAPIREIFEEFISHCNGNYTPGQYCTIDEILESFRGRCRFKVHNSNKPAKYGIKISALVDANTFYTSNLEVYTGKQPAGPYNLSNATADVVKRIASSILNTGRNITMDNHFTSVPLFDELKSTYETTAVGTLRKNKEEIPPLFLSTKDRTMPSSVLGFSNNNVLLSYVPKQKVKKVILILSSLHADDNIDQETGSQKIITFYNSTKSGVDVVDRIKEEYSVARITSRWPMRLFFTILNITGINAQIIYKANTETLIERREFLKKLALELVTPHISRRCCMQNISFDLKFIMKRFVPDPKAPENKTEPGPSGYCAVCPRRKNRRSKKVCISCSKSLCTEHVTFMCNMCYERHTSEDLME